MNDAPQHASMYQDGADQAREAMDRWLCMLAPDDAVRSWVNYLLTLPYNSMPDKSLLYAVLRVAQWRPELISDDDLSAFGLIREIKFCMR